MALKQATRGAQPVMSAEFAFSFNDTMKDTAGALKTFGSVYTDVGVFEVINLPQGAVVVPMLDEDTVLLVREYAAGLHRYELGLVKGRIDDGETPAQAGDRELKEEAGYGARRIDVLRAMSLAPTYMSHQSWLVLARDLYPERLAGDEPEELEVVPWKLADLDALMLREDFSEGRSLAALFIAREWLKERT